MARCSLFASVAELIVNGYWVSRLCPYSSVYLRYKPFSPFSPSIPHLDTTQISSSHGVPISLQFQRKMSTLRTASSSHADGSPSGGNPCMEPPQLAKSCSRDHTTTLNHCDPDHWLGQRIPTMASGMSQ